MYTLPKLTVKPQPSTRNSASDLHSIRSFSVGHQAGNNNSNNNDNDSNNNARPERKRAPTHRCATVEQRIHCETQYFLSARTYQPSQNDTSKKQGNLRVPLQKYCVLQGILIGRNFRFQGFLEEELYAGGLYCRSGSEELRGCKG